MKDSSTFGDLAMRWLARDGLTEIDGDYIRLSEKGTDMFVDLICDMQTVEFYEMMADQGYIYSVAKAKQEGKDDDADFLNREHFRFMVYIMVKYKMPAPDPTNVIYN